MKLLLHKISGRKWKPAKPNSRWQDNPRFVEYFQTQMSTAHETGYAGALRSATGDRPLPRAVSVGAGKGNKERALVKAGLVEHFDLYEVSADRIAESQRLAAEEGLSANFDEHLADALEEDIVERYDLVLWLSALHHMFDVDKALEWSVRALKPGGFLLIYEYVGPTRLQWHPTETRCARRFLKENHDLVGVDPKRVRRGTTFRRYKQFLRDPSEAPQSNLIPAAYERHTGEAMQILGGSAIHLCGGFVTGLEDQDPTIHDRVIALDKDLRNQGHYHFGYGLWQKPT
ncbi:class I SAM-dependent methyltransferase [uncultured Roseovarius sp.]|uniref:class I SAM-dependent methyltransferase n=1 Tax=uncultured Roseovarius sp. TaxID=293344 RepID=UPI0025F70A5B|nr:class I SAM-dependent methyltransferase [uncultured Roseovarius sp.]